MVPFTVVVVLLAMAGHRLEGWPSLLRTWAELLLGLPIVLWTGVPFFVSGWQLLIHRNPILYPVFGLVLSPIIAAVAMSLSSVSVVGNALRLRGARMTVPSMGCEG